MRFRSRLFIAVIPFVVVPMLTTLVVLGAKSHENLMQQESRILTLRLDAFEAELSSEMGKLRLLKLETSEFYVNRAVNNAAAHFSGSQESLLVVSPEAQVLVPANYPGGSLKAESHLRKMLGKNVDGIVIDDPDLPLPREQYMFSSRYDATEALNFLAFANINAINAPVYNAVQVTVILGAGFVFLTIIGLYRLSIAFSRPVSELSEIARKLADGDLSVRSERGGSDETGSLARNFNFMADRLSLMRHNLELLVQDRTLAYEGSLEDLRRAQAEILQMQKLASLGSLVSGFAHELNTPLGNSITAVSYCRSIVESYLNAGLSEKDGERRLELSKLQETMGLLQKNIERAATMVNRFKLVAADDMGEAARMVELGEFSRKRIPLIARQLCGDRLQIEFSGNGACWCIVPENALHSIFEELISNAFLHAYGGRPGIVRISTENREDGSDEILFSFGDEGRGMKEEMTEKVFEPFYTTRRGEGMIGLGLHIVFNLVTRQLKGRIVLKTRPGGGSQFEIYIPAAATGQ